MPIPYLHFQGTCAKALAFYAEVFGSPAPQLMHYAEAPGMPYPHDPDRVIHGQVMLPDGMLMASDFPRRHGRPAAGRLAHAHRS